MSNEAITWAFKQELPSIQKFVLVALADYADEAGECYPSMAKTANRVGASRSTVKRAVAALEEGGYLTTSHRHREDGNWTSNRYRLALGATFNSPTNGGRSTVTLGSQRPQGGPTVTLGVGSPWAGGRVTHEPAEPPMNPHSEPPVNPPSPTGDEVAVSAAPGGYSEDFLAWWQHYPRKQDKGAAWKAWKKIRGVPLEVLIAGADRYAADPNRSAQFTKHPATWLNARAWEDETPLPDRANGKISTTDRLASIQALKRPGGETWTTQRSLTS